ncbi:hypothetical protein DYB25_009479 [Aphanomyces astaci]|uniref:PPIase cyclophilin-type domain-containing protein n=1 Tax=Aphanomyces astaci TaxID=112090 RepID=A0A397C0K6_APHAT|nr:hypothetical protein DYB25_009479 [Aphanomyces astaci]
MTSFETGVAHAQLHYFPMNTSRRGHAAGGINYPKYITGFLVTLTLVYFVWVQKSFAPSSPPLLKASDAEAKLAVELTSAPPTPVVRTWSRAPGRRYVWIDVEIDGKPVGRITAELYMDIVPATAENFRALVTGDNAAGISYKGSVCHRIITGFIVQCGDFETGKEDEPAGLQLKHDKRYVLQMANSGEDTNGSQFCFMLGAAPHLNGRHVVFGQVVEGFEVVDLMETAGSAEDGVVLNHNVVLKDGGDTIAQLDSVSRKATAENFRGLVTGDNQPGWSYKNSTCHRILKGFVVQCGSYDTRGGTSIYGKDFEDEATGLTLKHSKRGILQMANAGPNTNGAQFCFMLGPAAHLNGHHVVFGEIVQGLDVLDLMEAAGVASDDDELGRSVMLVDGGEIFD